jgi:nucleoside-diphosphate-sugar epimerase
LRINRQINPKEQAMKVFLAGATGALGVPLVRALVSAGHEVIGLTRTPAGARSLAALNARAVIADAMDRAGLLRAVDGLRADAVIHQLTALKRPPTRHDGMFATNALRIEGTANLIAAARAVGAVRFVTQSMIYGYGYLNHGSKTVTEQDAFGQPHGDKGDPHIAAMRSTEQQVFTAAGIEGIALRYGLFYGADTDKLVAMMRKRQLPVTRVRADQGWVHIQDAAAATVAALERGHPGAAYNIVDDQPTSWTEMVTQTAAAFGAPRPLALPTWLLRIVAPYVALAMAQTSMRVSNAKAKKELGWTPSMPTYRDGIRAMANLPA